MPLPLTSTTSDAKLSSLPLSSTLAQLIPSPTFPSEHLQCSAMENSQSYPVSKPAAKSCCAPETPATPASRHIKDDIAPRSALPSFYSPAYTPPSTPGSRSPKGGNTPKSVPVDTTGLEPPAELLKTLPVVNCVVRARIPTTNGTEMFLHLYNNNVDNKEHMAIVFGSSIRSKSLDAVQEGESEWDRMVRGAYVGRLRPGRISSRVDDAQQTPEETAYEMPLTLAKAPAPLVRIHSSCYTGETVWSARCDCGEQLDEAARLMSLPSSSGHPPSGVIVYLQQEGRGIGLASKLAAYNLQDLGKDTYEANLILRHPADARDYGLATSILMDLDCGGDDGIRLLTNNPDKVRAVEGPNKEVRVCERVAMVPLAWTTQGQKGVRSEEVEKYLSTKIEKFKHMLNRDE